MRLSVRGGAVFRATLPVLCVVGFWGAAGANEQGSEVAPSEPPRSANAIFVAVIDADGAVTSIRTANDMPPLVKEVLVADCATRRFEPATSEGRAVSSELPLVAVVQEDPAVARGMSVRSLKVSRNAILPRYPVDGLRGGHQASFMLRLESSADPEEGGVTVSVEGVEYPRKVPSKVREQFEAAALQALSKCCEFPERIDGRAVAWIDYAPVHFMLGNKQRIDPEDFEARWRREPGLVDTRMQRARLIAK